MSQVAAKKKLTLQNESVTVTARFREEGSVLQGTQDGTCEGFSIQLSLDGDEAVEEIVALVRLAHKMCFTEDALTREINVEVSHLFNGQPLEVRPPS